MFFTFLQKYLPIIVICFAVVFFFRPVLSQNLPIPSDTIIGLYHPFRDLYGHQYPRGIPFKNSLITDPVRQEYPWRFVSISQIQSISLPLWNQYSFSGTPLLANFQSAIFNPFNILFFVFSFSSAWSILIGLQTLLSGIFLYVYLRNIHIEKASSLLGSIVFMFCGFSVSWLEWGTIIQTGLWLPLILLSVDKILVPHKEKLLRWYILFIFTLVCSFFAGHLQTFFYVGVVSFMYALARWWQHSKKVKHLLLFAICYLLFIAITAIQWIPTLQFILLSARDTDQLGNWQKDGWFIPWGHLIQFVVPDFFGNPTTLNYWGTWNYGELTGYVGIIPLVLALYALFFRRDKKTFFFGTLCFIALIFALPTYISSIPFVLNIPFLATAQPTRLLYIVDFSLSVLAAFGLDYAMKKQKHVFVPLLFLSIVFLGIWLFVLLGNNSVPLISEIDMPTVKRNLLYSTVLFSISLLMFISFLCINSKKFTKMLVYMMICFVLFDLLRFAEKFTPFTQNAYLFPATKTTQFLQKHIGNQRMMSIDNRIMPPNFSTMYKLQDIGGYDPLFIKRYGELIAASERGKPDISVPLGFNRIITPQNYSSPIMDLLGVKYILSLSDIRSDKLHKVFQEGETRIYQNRQVVSRAFFVENVYVANSKQDAIELLFVNANNLEKSAVVEDAYMTDKDFHPGKATIVSYSANKVVIETDNQGEGFLVFTDINYPTWKSNTRIYQTDYAFRGVVVPAGRQQIIFYNTLF